MAIEPKAIRIAAWTAAVACAAALAVGVAGHLYKPPSPVQPVACESVPSNVVRLGPALPVQETAVAPANELGWSALREKLRAGDRIHPFETATTGGHLALRGNCYLGATTAWVR
jgi:hypothetical protein